MSEPWDSGPGGGGWDGWAASAEAERPLRRHAQPRHQDGEVDDGHDGAPHRVPARRRPDPSSFDPALTTVDGSYDGAPGLEPAHGDDAPPSPQEEWAHGSAPAADGLLGLHEVDSLHEADRVDGAARSAGTARRIGSGGRRDRGFDAAIGPSSWGSLQPGSRLRIGPRHGSGARREDPRPKTPLRAALGAGSEIVVVLGMALLLSLLIKTFLVQAFFIPSTSMENTLLVGDRVLVSKLTPGVFQLHRGDVVVFKDPGGWLTAEESAPRQDQGGVAGTVRNALSFVGLLPQDAGEHLIKRVVAVGGDHVQCCDPRGRVEVNGVAIDETSYLIPGAAPSDKPFDVTVPYGYLWVMGDNRPVSADSRLHRGLNNGMVPVHDVVGKAFVIVWPFDRAGGLGIPDTVFGRVPQPAPH